MEFEYQRVFIPRETSRSAAQRLLSEHAEYGHWELERTRLFPDGSRRVILKRKIIRARSTLISATA